MPTKKVRAVVVTTAHRGVFVGYTSDPDGAERVTLTQARMVVFYSTDTKGVLGIASKGLASGSRVTDAVPRIDLRNITAVIDATPEATAAWEKGPWG